MKIKNIYFVLLFILYAFTIGVILISAGFMSDAIALIFVFISMPFAMLIAIKTIGKVLDYE